MFTKILSLLKRSKPTISKKRDFNRPKFVSKSGKRDSILIGQPELIMKSYYPNVEKDLKVTRYSARFDLVKANYVVL